MLKVLVGALSEHKKMKGIQIGVKMSVFVNDTIVYIENPKESAKAKQKPLRINNSSAGLQDAR